MPWRRIKRSFEEEEEFQQQRRKRKADNQCKRNETIKALIKDNNIQMKPNTKPYIVSYVNDTMHSSHIINLSNEINGESSVNVTTVCQSVYQSNYRERT